MTVASAIPCKYAARKDSLTVLELSLDRQPLLVDLRPTQANSNRSILCQQLVLVLHTKGCVGGGGGVGGRIGAKDDIPANETSEDTTKGLNAQ